MQSGFTEAMFTNQSQQLQTICPSLGTGTALAALAADLRLPGSRTSCWSSGYLTDESAL